MAAQSKKTSAVASYRFCRYYAGLLAGPTLTVQTKRAEPVAIHHFQGSFTSNCGQCCLSMVLCCFGLLKRSASESMTHRRFGLAAQVWTVMEPYFFTGITAPELKAAVESVDALDAALKLTMQHTSGKVSAASSTKVTEFAVRCLFQGKLTLLAYTSIKNRHKHWLLGTAVEGVGTAGKSAVDTLLALDPANDVMPYAISNVRLRRKSAGHLIYEGAGFSNEPVRLISALCIELRQ